MSQEHRDYAPAITVKNNSSSRSDLSSDYPASSQGANVKTTLLWSLFNRVKGVD